MVLKCVILTLNICCVCRNSPLSLTDGWKSMRWETKLLKYYTNVDLDATWDGVKK